MYSLTIFGQYFSKHGQHGPNHLQTLKISETYHVHQILNISKNPSPISLRRIPESPVRPPIRPIQSNIYIITIVFIIFYPFGASNKPPAQPPLKTAVNLVIRGRSLPAEDLDEPAAGRRSRSKWITSAMALWS